MLHFFLLESKNYQCTFFNNHFSGCTMHSPCIFRNCLSNPYSRCGLSLNVLQLSIFIFFQAHEHLTWPLKEYSHSLELFCSLLLYLQFNLCIFNFFIVQNSTIFLLLFALITSPFTMLIWLLFISSFLFYIFVLKNQTSSYNIDLQPVIYVRYSATMWKAPYGCKVK